MSADVVVVGAGAAGLWAAASVARALGPAKEPGRVVLLEKTARTGTKVLASGGTRCNLTTTLDARAAAELFGPAGARFLAPSLRRVGPLEVRRRFDALGVPTVEAPLEKVFPASGRARDVRDALERDARQAGVEVALGRGLRELEAVGERGKGGWRLALTDGSSLEAARVVLAPGGRSYARTGTTGDGYAWIAGLDLPLVEPVPALVPLTSPAAWVRELAGVSLQDAAVRLLDEPRRVLGRRARPLLFTHQGVSGPAAMDLSEPVARAASAGRKVDFTLEVDLCPDLDREALRALLIEVAGRSGAPFLTRALGLPLPRRVALAALLQAGYDEEPRANGLDKAGRHRVVEAFKGLAVPIDGTLGFDHAEVTAGGLALTHVDPGTMRVRGYENLWACGELLDLTGPIGGLNFLAAFATAESAAVDVASA